MHTNPFNPVCTFARIHGSRFFRRTSYDEYQVFFLFKADAHGTYINIPMTLRSGSPGGLKGRIAPGDAHPYLVLFDANFSCVLVAVNSVIATKLQ